MKSSKISLVCTVKTKRKCCHSFMDGPRISSYLTHQPGPDHISAQAHPACSLLKAFCAFNSKRILNLTQIISVPPRADAYLRVVRSFSRFMLICLRPIALLRSARLWQRRGGALPPCNFIFAPSFGFLPDYIHTYIEGVVMRFHIIEKLSQNFDFVTILMILTF